MFRKKVLGLTMIALMIGCMGVSVSAHEADDVASASEIMPRGPVCSKCENGMLIIHDDTDRELVHNYPCSHYNYGRDYNYKVTRTITSICDSCDYRDETITVTYETDCQGYN